MAASFKEWFDANKEKYWLFEWKIIDLAGAAWNAGVDFATAHNTGMLADAQICQNIVEDQLNYLIRIGLDFKEGEKDSVRDNLYRIVAGKLQHT